MPLPPLLSPPGFGRRLVAHVVAIPLALWLFASLLGFNVLQVASLLLVPFSTRGFRAFNRWAAGVYWGMCVDLGMFVWRIRVESSGDSLPAGENVILLANHQDMADITFLMFLAHRLGRLGDMKWMLKKGLRWVPGMGWGLSFLDCVFVARDWTRDRATIEATFRHLTTRRIPVWMVSFPEGTRMRPGKLAASQEYQRGRGLTPLRHVLMPRTKGFAASVQGLRGHVDAICDVTIGYEGGVPTLWQYVKGYARVAHLHVRRFPLDSLPDDEPGLSAWLLERFREKDAVLDTFYREGRFPRQE